VRPITDADITALLAYNAKRWPTPQNRLARRAWTIRRLACGPRRRPTIRQAPATLTGHRRRLAGGDTYAALVERD
jgi:hypothetical protein